VTLLAESTPVVDWGKLGQVVAYSAVVGIGVAIAFALAILGATRFTDARRDGGGVAAAAGYALLATLGLAATLAAAVIAIVVMTKKG
jgi:hypothetical protein